MKNPVILFVVLVVDPVKSFQANVPHPFAVIHEKYPHGKDNDNSGQDYHIREAIRVNTTPARARNDTLLMKRITFSASSSGEYLYFRVFPDWIEFKMTVFFIINEL